MSVRPAVLLIAIIGFNHALADSPADRWNLAELYPSADAWNAEATELEGEMKELAACKGHLGDSARFEKCLDLQADVAKRFTGMNLYASEQLAEDTGAAASLELWQKAEVSSSRLNEKAFINPEVLRLGKKRITRFLA